MPDTKQPRSPLDFLPIVLVTSGALLVSAGVLFALAVADHQSISGDEQFRLVGQAASPIVAALVLGGVSLAVHERRLPGEERTIVASSFAVGVGIVAALLTVLLALNGVVVDVVESVPTGIRVSKVIGRVATLLIAGLALVAGVLAPTGPRRPDTRADAMRPPSVLGDRGPVSRG
ncbi:MAG TPA: hypothetical protein VF230_00685 [Acidimicrobiales bacterium]